MIYEKIYTLYNFIRNLYVPFIHKLMQFINNTDN